MPGVLPALNPPMSIINCTLLHMSFAISVTFSLILINFFVSLIADNEEKSLRNEMVILWCTKRHFAISPTIHLEPEFFLNTVLSSPPSLLHATISPISDLNNIQK